MKIFKYNKLVDVDKRCGNLRLTTINYGTYENGKSRSWSELRLWYDNDCEHCPCCWEYRSYEGECEDCGCYLAKKGHEEAKTFVCMLPRWIKIALMRMKGIKE